MGCGPRCAGNAIAGTMMRSGNAKRVEGFLANVEGTKDEHAVIGAGR